MHDKGKRPYQYRIYDDYDVIPTSSSNALVKKKSQFPSDDLSGKSDASLSTGVEESHQKYP